MLRLVITLVALGMFGATLVGCHAEGTVEKPNGAAAFVPGR